MSIEDTIINDSEWIKNSFMIPTHAQTEIQHRRRAVTDAAIKYVDTTIGGNLVQNPPPQFTRFADIKALNNFASDTPFSDWQGAIASQYTASRGIGRYYSESIDDNNQVIHMRFGVPAFNSLSSFFTSFYEPSTGYLANKGRASSLFFSLGKAAGSVISIVAWPVILAGKMYRFFLQKPSSKYYYMKPTMLLYWNTVNTICNSLAANMGIVPRLQLPFISRMDPGDQLTPEQGAAFHRVLPDVYRPDGTIDIYAIANKAQRLAQASRANLAKALEGDDSVFGGDGPSVKMRDALAKYAAEKLDPSHAAGSSLNKKTAPALQNEESGGFLSGLMDYIEERQAEIAIHDQGVFTGIDAYIEAWGRSEYGSVKADVNSGNDGVENDSIWGTADQFKDLLAVELKDGSQFVSFAVDYSGTAGESFSNSTRESEIGSTVNGISSSARSKRWTLADGNIGDGPIAGMIEGFLGATADFMAGVADGVGMGGLMALGGRGIADFPKHWESSSANLPRMDYTIELRSPYGDKMSRYQNLMIPLAMILAGALPLSTGKQSYTSPFLCQVFSRGRAVCRLGMIDSVSITRGAGNLGWNQEDEPLGIDISFSVVDMSTVISVPISAGLGLIEGVGLAAAETATGLVDSLGSAVTGKDNLSGGMIEGAIAALNPNNYDDDNSFTDYMSVLASVDVGDLIYGSNQLKLRATQRMLEWKSWRSVSHFANWAATGTLPGRVVSIFARQAVRDE